MQRITSRQNPRLKQVAALLQSSRDRRKSGFCVIEGEHLVQVYVGRVGAPEVLVIADEAFERDAVQALQQRVPATRVLVVPTRMFAELAVLPADVGILAVVPTPQTALPAPENFHLLLEDVQDPGNVGSMLRTAAAAGVDQVLLSKSCAFAWAPKTLRAGQGAHFLTTIVENVDLVAWSVAFSRAGGQVVATVPQSGHELYRCELDGRVAIAIGNEGAGLSAPMRQQATRRVTIPMPGGMESLNAAAAAAVVLFECVRQRSARER